MSGNQDLTVVRYDVSHDERRFRMKAPVLLNITDTAAYLTAHGIEVKVPTLRDWRKTWPNGQCKGPRPILITTRKLRYLRDDCDALIETTLNGSCPALISGSA